MTLYIEDFKVEGSAEEIVYFITNYKKNFIYEIDVEKLFGLEKSKIKMEK